MEQRSRAVIHVSSDIKKIYDMLLKAINEKRIVKMNRQELLIALIDTSEIVPWNIKKLLIPKKPQIVQEVLVDNRWLPNEEKKRVFDDSGDDIRERVFE